MKDYIEITDINNKTRQVEVVTIFQMEGSPYNYIIYRELDDSHNYVAKYKGNNIAILNTDLTDLELKFAEVIYRGVKA